MARPAAVLLVHHADALGPNVDPQRPLSAHGLRQAEWLARHAKERGVSPAAIWHSGKLRARQTAEQFLRVCQPYAEFRMVRGLRPDDAPDLMRGALETEDRNIVVVSHMPLLPALAAMLTSTIESFPLHGAIALERDGPQRYVEQWRAQPPDVY